MGRASALLIYVYIWGLSMEKKLTRKEHIIKELGVIMYYYYSNNTNEAVDMAVELYEQQLKYRSLGELIELLEMGQ